VVRAALGNYFGGVSLAAVTAECQECPISEPDAYWQDISVSYVEYVLRNLKESAASPRGCRMISFHEWRRDEDIDHRGSLMPDKCHPAGHRLRRKHAAHQRGGFRA
jgi:hypothetical protein